MDENLIGKKIWLLIGEPWNFHQFIDPKDSIGEVTSAVPTERDWITVKWEFEWDGVIYLFGMLRSRHAGYENLIERIPQGEYISCNMIFFERASELGAKLPTLSADELSYLDTHYEDLVGKVGLIGGIQQVGKGLPPWNRDHY